MSAAQLSLQTEEFEAMTISNDENVGNEQHMRTKADKTYCDWVREASYHLKTAGVSQKMRRRIE